jgi:hypothetical protein
MSSIQFKQHPNKRKTWLFPLIIIVLLYLTIPILLINKGKDSFDKAAMTIESDVIKAANYYNSGFVFTDLAESFPGFAAWAEKTAINGKNKIVSRYSEKCKEIQNKNEDEQNKFCKNMKSFVKKTSIQLPECEGVCE